MSGGTGADLFLFIKGDGKDTISDFNIAVDKLSFGSSITYQDLSFTMDTVNGVKGVTVHYSPVDIVFLQGVTSTHLPQSDFMFT